MAPRLLLEEDIVRFNVARRIAMEEFLEYSGKRYRMVENLIEHLCNATLGCDRKFENCSLEHLDYVISKSHGCWP